MRKNAFLILILWSVFSGFISYAYADDIDSQILEIEQQIEELQGQLNELKAQKAQIEVGDINSDELYVETDRFFNIYNSYSCKKFDAIIEITNISKSPLYLSDATFDLEDDDGHLLQTDTAVQTAPDVIMPGEKGYFYNNFGTEIDSSIKKVYSNNSVTFVPHYKIEVAEGIPHEYPLSDLSLGEDAVVGRIMNDTDDDDARLYINAMFYNDEGKIIGVTGTNVTDMPIGENTSFDISTTVGIQDSFNSSEVVDYKVVAQEPYYQ